jgi:hypothetical protein
MEPVAPTIQVLRAETYSCWEDLLRDRGAYAHDWQHYRPQLIDCLMQMPCFIEIVRTGLEKIYHNSELDKEQMALEQVKQQLLLATI